MRSLEECAKCTQRRTQGHALARKITLTKALLSALEDRHIAIFPRVRAGHAIRDTGAAFEPKSQFPNTWTMPLGSFSYSLSAFGPCARIGRYCSIGERVQVFGDHHPINHVSTSPVFYRPKRFKRWTGQPPHHPMPAFRARPDPITIGNDVWIGNDVILRDGIRIGDGAVVATGSTVTKDVAPYTIVGGNPARHLKDRFPREIAKALQTLAWWDYDIMALQALPTQTPEDFLKSADHLKDAPRLPEDRLTLADLVNETG